MAQVIGNPIGARSTPPHGAVRRIARHFLVLLSWEAVGRLARFVTSVYLARTLGPSAFGLLAFGQALLAYVALGGDWGLGTYGAREVASGPENWVRVWLQVSIVRAGVGAALTAVVVAIVAASHWDALTKWVVAASVLSAVPMTLMPDWVYRGRERMATAGLLLSGQLLIALIGILLFVRTSADVVTVPFVRLAAATFVAAAAQVALVVSSREQVGGARADFRPGGHEISRLLRVGVVFLSGNLAVMAYYNIDVVLLRFMQGDQIVGWYSSAYRVIWVPMAVFSALSTAAFPVLTQQGRSGAEAARATLQPLVRLCAVTGVATALVVAVFRQQIISLLYGPAFHPAAAPLGLLAVVIPLEFLTALVGMSYVARGLERPVLTCVVGSALVNILTNVMLIPRFGMMGAATATVVSYTALLAAFVIWFEKGPLRTSTETGTNPPRS
jgi:O-antigen/teichoic acid export membrane protein